MVRLLIKVIGFALSETQADKVRDSELANNMEIAVMEKGDRILFTDALDGDGLEPEKIRLSVEMRSIQNRVAHHKGDFEYQSRAGTGSFLSVELPLT
jgi:signal transduction histidine kinase